MVGHHALDYIVDVENIEEKYECFLALDYQKYPSGSAANIMVAIASFQSFYFHRQGK